MCCEGKDGDLAREVELIYMVYNHILYITDLVYLRLESSLDFCKPITWRLYSYNDGVFRPERLATHGSYRFESLDHILSMY